MSIVSTRMSPSATSLFVFGLYSIALGLTLLTVPNVLFRLVGLPETSEVWARVSGMLLFCLGIYYTLAGRAGLTEFFKWTTYTRASVIVFFSVFVALGLVKPVLLVLAVIDLAFAIWTAVALRTEKTPVTANR